MTTTAHELPFASATELAAALAKREIASVELLDLFAERIRRHDGPLNSVIALDLERARERARAIDDARVRGEDVGPLGGLPITVKDSLETAGLRTTAGAASLAEHVPTSDATIVERTVRAGAVVFGKTNLPLMAGDVQTYNALFGTTNNVWNHERTPGGSSGGAAVAVASGFTSFELGSDIGGSIRTPSHWTGVYGHKPSYDVIPVRGHIPFPPGWLSEADLGVVGPIARSADDLELLLRVQAGPLAEKAHGWKLELPGPRRSRLADYRVAAWFDDASFPVDDAVRGVLASTAQALRAAGAAVDEGARPPFRLAELFDTYMRLLAPVIVSGFPPEQFEMMAAMAASGQGPADGSLAMMAAYGTARHRDWLEANEARHRYRAACADFFSRYDILLLPVNPVTAIPHDQREPMPERTILVNGERRPYFELLAWISPATCCYLPATAAPVGVAPDGLPVGIQIVGGYLEDSTTIDFAKRLAEVAGGFRAPELA